MQNLVSFIDIPAQDFDRAVAFYRTVLDTEIHEQVFGTDRMGFFPADGSNVSGAIVQGSNHQPSMTGVLAYLDGGDDLQTVLDRVAPNGGKVLVPKTQISPEVGHVAIFVDSEGNRMALHSPR